MGLLGAAAKTAFPLSRAGVALWAWRHRGEIGDWAAYAARSAPRVVAGDTADVLAEGRLRARLTADSRTRGADGLRVEVLDGVAVLTGTVTPDVHDAALAIATETTGIARVRDQLVDRKGRRARQPR